MSSTSEEARTAAWAMARLIHEHGVVMGLPGKPYSARQAPVDAAMVDAIDDLLSGIREGMRRERPKARKEPAEAPTGWIKIRTSFVGECLACGEAFERGETLWWWKGVGCRHLWCDPPPVGGRAA